MKKLSLNNLGKTKFIELYQKLFYREKLNIIDYEKLLTLALIFLNQEDINIQRLGYRIIIFYSNKTKDYIPLYDVSINSGLIPISKYIENLENYKSEFENNFIRSLSSSFCEIYKQDEIYLTEEQLNLHLFFKDNLNETLSIIAPTSYGKSDLIISILKKRINQNICIIVPTKALLAQTRNRIIKANIDNIHKIIIHPEMYSIDDTNITAVLTQERLLRLIKKNNKLSFDVIIVDEAHNLLEHDSRNILLASAIVILKYRNPKSVFKFLTPFLSDSKNLEVKFTNYSINTFKIQEYVKTEKIYIYDFKKDNKLKIYDQFVNKFFEINNNTFDNVFRFIIYYMQNKNIIYINKPPDIEKLSIELSSKQDIVTSRDIEKACTELSKYFHKEYSLIECLKKGIVYHHGSVPENIRIYIEHIFSKDNNIKFIVTSSTLLEGVNIPAECLFVLNNKKGRRKLSPSQTRNLIGRVCRFNDIFSNKNGSMFKLEPSIYFVVSEYCASKTNIENYVIESLKVDKEIKDNPSNVLLKNVKIDKKNKKLYENSEEFIENFENGVVPNYNKRIAQTEVGKLCYTNNIIDIDIITNEYQMQNIIDNKRLNEFVILNSTEDILDIISDLFIPYIKDDESSENIKRLVNKQARKFYKMFLDWRINNTSFREMITSFLKYWEGLEEKKLDTLVYVGKWGDEKRGGYSTLWTDIKKKSIRQRINLAIVRIKEEQDFLDNILIKYIEVINELGFVHNKFYEKIKYGTSDISKITLIKNGYSIGLANLLIDKYIEFVKIDYDKNVISISNNLIPRMRKHDENDIHIFEVIYNMKYIE